ncbi:hypothetical protein BH10PLA1_BH10PLA1_03230 [soil metagenome]
MAACVIGLMTVWIGCTAQRRYRVLSVFFDGVPDPNAPKLVRGGRGVNGNGDIVVLVSHIHKPYADGNCEACHTGGTDSVFRVSSGLAIDSSVCLKCHEKVLREFPVMHGPVTAVECLRCHTPHESNSDHLLATASPRVCVQCHTPELLGLKPAAHRDKTADCLTCHFAHGGPQHRLLREATTRPATQPAIPTTVAINPPVRP